MTKPHIVKVSRESWGVWWSHADYIAGKKPEFSLRTLSGARMMCRAYTNGKFDG